MDRITGYLLPKGHEVHGVVQRASTFNTSWIDQIYIDLHRVGSGTSIRELYDAVLPPAIMGIRLAAERFVFKAGTDLC